MRTTVDIPDGLFRRAKARAAMEGVKLKELIARFVELGLRLPVRAPRDESGASEGAERPFVSAFDLMKDGCGIVKSGVPDLASNPKHLEGFASIANTGRHPYR
jgi:hypothetical protein